MFLKEISKRKQNLSIDFIKQVAGLVMKNTGGLVNAMAGTFDISSGDLRKAQVYIDKKYFPDFSKVEGLLIQLIDNVNQRSIGAISSRAHTQVNRKQYTRQGYRRSAW